MFKFLKEKLKGAISKFTRKVEEEAKVGELVKEETEQKEEAKKEEIQEISAKKSQEGIKKEKEIQSPEERDLIEELEAEIQETKEEAWTTSGAQTQFGISQGDTPSVEKKEIKAEEKFNEIKKPEEQELDGQKSEVVEKKGFFSKLKEKITA